MAARKKSVTVQDVKDRLLVWAGKLINETRDAADHARQVAAEMLLHVVGDHSAPAPAKRGRPKGSKSRKSDGRASAWTPARKAAASRAAKARWAKRKGAAKGS